LNTSTNTQHTPTISISIQFNQSNSEE
jgi:hypothetical protein